jgi:hypothetical protein
MELTPTATSNPATSQTANGIEGPAALSLVAPDKLAMVDTLADPPATRQELLLGLSSGGLISLLRPQPAPVASPDTWQTLPAPFRRRLDRGKSLRARRLAA